MNFTKTRTAYHPSDSEGLSGLKRRVLVVAYYFPPMGLSGVQRIAKLVKYLPQSGWEPTVLSVKPRGYFAYDESLAREMQDAGIRVIRTRSVDPTRLFGRSQTVALPEEGRRKRLAHLSQWVFVPDNKVGWIPFAWKAGQALLRAERFDAILSTAPPYTAHLIGALLARAFDLPLLLDYRDDWVGNPRHTYPTRFHRFLNRFLEGWAMRSAAGAMTINEPIRQSISRRSPRTPVYIVPQGYDPSDFNLPDHGSELSTQATCSERPVMRWVYSGVFYDAQTPDYFLRALAVFLYKHPLARREVQARFVGLVPQTSQALAKQLGLEDVVHYTGYLSHNEAVGEVKAADVLWMTIGRRPGAEGISTSKLFEYFGARKPILALVPEGAARDALQPHGASLVVPPDDVSSIADALETWYGAWKEGRLPDPDWTYVQSFDRQAIAQRVGQLLIEACNTQVVS